jgi:hypothetical protein
MACLVLAPLVGGAACTTLAPLAVKWGADLISAAAANYSPRYSKQLEGLLLAIYEDKVAKKVTGAGAGSGESTAYPAPSSPYPRPAESSAAVGSGSNSAYPPVSSSSARATDEPNTGTSNVLDVAVLAQKASERAARRSDPVPIRDGDKLRDGGSDPRKGDVVKFSFRANCACYVYVIGVDATGHVTRVFPEKESKPVRPDQQYVVPEGTAWYGLDQYKGTEQVFFIASRRPRQDIERSLQQLSQTGRSAVSRSYRPVREAVLPDADTRGLVKVQMGTRSTVSSESGERHSFTPQAFAARAGSDDVAVTRWFRHE